MKGTNFSTYFRKSQSTIFLTVLILLITFAGVSGQENAAKNSPVFSNFVYQGDDQVYKDYPLEADEFYSPILQGCYPDPSITRKG